MNNCWRIFFDIKKMEYYLVLHANGNVIKYEICRVMYEELKNMFGKKEAKMTSREALNDLKERIIHPEYFGKSEMLNELAIIEKDLEILEIFKKHLEHCKGYYENQANWSREEFWFSLESDNIWLEEEQREQYIKDFNKIKEWYLKEVEND